MVEWWDKKYGKNAICGITKTRLRPGKNKNGISYIITLPCNHSFYRKPLINWINKSKKKYKLKDNPDNIYNEFIIDISTCPLCRCKFSFKIKKK